MMDTLNIDALLKERPSLHVAQQLVRWTNARHNRISRGDMTDAQARH
jgi:hypothetical protein